VYQILDVMLGAAHKVVLILFVRLLLVLVMVFVQNLMLLLVRLILDVPFLLIVLVVLVSVMDKVYALHNPDVLMNVLVVKQNVLEHKNRLVSCLVLVGFGVQPRLVLLDRLVVVQELLELVKQ
jgi:hypothetical protein